MKPVEAGYRIGIHEYAPPADYLQARLLCPVNCFGEIRSLLKPDQADSFSDRLSDYLRRCLWFDSQEHTVRHKGQIGY